MSEILNPCPCCGGSPVVRKWNWGGLIRSWYNGESIVDTAIECSDCGLTTRRKVGVSKEHAVAMWNCRTPVKPRSTDKQDPVEVKRAIELVTTYEWKGDTRVVMTKVIGAGIVLAKAYADQQTATDSFRVVSEIRRRTIDRMTEELKDQQDELDRLRELTGELLETWQCSDYDTMEKAYRAVRPIVRKLVEHAAKTKGPDDE